MAGTTGRLDPSRRSGRATTPEESDQQATAAAVRKNFHLTIQRPVFHGRVRAGRRLPGGKLRAPQARRCRRAPESSRPRPIACRSSHRARAHPARARFEAGRPRIAGVQETSGTNTTTSPSPGRVESSCAGGADEERVRAAAGRTHPRIRANEGRDRVARVSSAQ